MSYQGQKHFFIVSSGVLANGMIQSDAVPFMVLLLYDLHVNLSPCSDNSSESPFICASLVDCQPENLLKVLLWAGQALHSGSQYCKELVLGVSFQILQY